MKRVHLVCGWIFAAAFALTGVWMQAHFPAAYRGDVGARMLYRSAHVYILLGSFPNCLLGVYLRPAQNARRARLQRAGSFLIVLAPVAFTVAFFLEPAPGALSRPYAAIGLWSAIFGTLAHLVGMRGDGLVPADAPARTAHDEPRVQSPPRANRVPTRGVLGMLALVAALALVVAGTATWRERMRAPEQHLDDGRVAAELARISIAVTPAEKRAVAAALATGRRFAECGDGTVIDLANNRMWAATDNGNATDWPGAMYFARMFRAGGYTDWRLPTIGELLALAHGYLGPDGKPLPGAPHVESWLPIGYGVPWSSETRGAEAARVHLGSSAVGWLPQDSTSHNRAVPMRGGAVVDETAADVHPDARLDHALSVSASLFAAEADAPR